MTAPTVHQVAATKRFASWLTSQTESYPELYLKYFSRIFGAFLLLAGLTFLSGCQGVSAAGNSSQPQASNLSLTANGLNFGSVAAGNSKSMPVTALNSGSSAITISSATISTKYFSLTAPSLPVTLAAGQSIVVSIQFTPDQAGAFNSTLAIASSASNAVANVSLSGTGVAAPTGQLVSTTSSAVFGSAAIGTQQSQTITLTNMGGSSVDISQAIVSGAGFQLSGISTPLTLGVSKSTSFSVTFAPQTAGSATGAVTITSNGSNPTFTIPLSGTGISAGALGSNPASLSFGSVQVGSKQLVSENVTNTGGTSVTISQVAVSGIGFSLSGITTPITLAAGQGASFAVAFTPSSAGTASGSVTVSSNAANPSFTIALSGTGISPGSLSANPTSLSLGNVTVGTHQSLSETLTNTGGTSVTISQVAVSGAGFSVSGINTPLTLTAGQSASFSITFTPASPGSVGGNVTITSNAPNPTLAIPLSATGIAPGVLGSNPATLSFGSVTVGSNQSLSETVTNTGGTSVTISQVAASGGFSVSGISTPVTLASGQSETFTAAFAPSASGSATGAITITSNATNPTLTVALSGTGVSPGALSASPATLSLGNVTVGGHQTVSGVLTNTGGTSVTISQVGVSGTGFTLSGITTPVTLTAGQSTSFGVTFTPASAGTVNGSVTITSNAPNPTLAIPVSGTGVTPGVLGSNPSSLSFGNVTVGNNQSLSETITNTGGTSVTISQIGVNGTGFTLSGITTPVTLTDGQSTSFNVSFAPTAAGSANGTVTITSNASNPTLTIGLSGTGAQAAGQLSVTPSTLGLGSVVVGTSGTASGSLMASGASVTITAASSSNSAFTLGGLSLPLTLPAGQSTSFTVTFSPQVSGATSATLTFTSNAMPSVTTEALTGSGTAQPTYTVNLSWSASTSPDISGYNIYRAAYTNTCGSFSKVNSVLNTTTLYTDSVVLDGSSYCYATTAVNTSNEESGYSNVVSNIQIPSP